MSKALLAGEPMIRLAVFLGMLVLMVGWEAILPRRPRLVSRRARWPGNLGVAALNMLFLRLALPLGAVGVAVFAAQRGWWLLNSFSLPVWLAVVVAVILLDLAIYLQHVMFHAVRRCGGSIACITPISMSTSLLAPASIRSRS